MRKVSCQEYEVWVGNDALVELIEFIKAKEYAQYLVLVDHNTDQHCYPAFAQCCAGIELSKLLIPAGEEHKNLDTCRHIWDSLIQFGADRHSVLINLGGGVIGDMGGFCASTFMRGMDFVQIPTTLLSQVDASVGGKLGIDYHAYKNLVGIYNNPVIIASIPKFLESLPFPELRSGYAEIIKHALISDANLYEYLEASDVIGEHDWEALVHKNVELKKAVVEDDPTEKGLRKILNFGHTIGHAVETAFLNAKTPILHGEAIAIGMIAETFLSQKVTGLEKNSMYRIIQFLLRHYDDLPLELPDTDTVLSLMAKDKKNIGGKIMFSLLDRIGSCQYNVEVPQSLIIESLKYYETANTN